MVKKRSILFALASLTLIGSCAHSISAKDSKDTSKNVRIYYMGPNYKSLDMGYFKDGGISFKDESDVDAKERRIDLSNSSDNKKLLGMYHFGESVGPFHLIGTPSDDSNEGIAVECSIPTHGATIPMKNGTEILPSLVLKTSLSYDPVKKQAAGSCTIEDIRYTE